VHALIDENGLGESMFIKVLSGYLQSEKGQLIRGARHATGVRIAEVRRRPWP
jgi:ABC-type uncharacterized transport system ATPase subunit